ncbi:hypothetical protein [Methylobacterium oryzisoli]|uniref:hypothetical protein n=1 Tax=Methylobacterium oryzisoli TaxID=3385502 RepID=UPI003892A5EC
MFYMLTKPHEKSNRRREAASDLDVEDLRRLDEDFRRRLRGRLLRRGLPEAEVERCIEDLMTREIPFRLDVEAALNAKD